MSATGCARTVVEALLQLGVRQVVLCPGSRSAPLAFAVEEAARRGRIELHVRIDERGAGFLALGMAKASGRVVPVVTTSGTAVGNLWPAVMEASHAGVPLLVLSADRPAPMRHTGANQTTDQAGLFGRFARAEGEIASGEGGSRAWAFHVGRLVAAAVGTRTRDPGPAHLNVTFAEPLMPEDENWPEVRGAEVAPCGPGVEPMPITGERAVVLVGDARPEEGRRAAALARQAGLPLLSEPSGNARWGEALRAYRLLLDTDLAHEIATVVVFGHPTLSRPVARLLAREDVKVIAVGGGARWADPGMTVRAVVDDVLCAGGDPRWLERWRRADALLSARLDELLGRELSGPSVAAAVWAAADPRQPLVVGSSHPIRDLDLAPVGPSAPPAYANRGLAGIDGTIATALGIGLVNGPVTVLLGDLTFLHDAGSLLIGPLERRPDIRVVVVNDDGGSIFHVLEQGAKEYAGSFERIFATPTGVDLGSLAAAYGWEHQVLSTLAELRRRLAEPVQGQQILEIRVRRDDRRDLAEKMRIVRSEKR